MRFRVLIITFMVAGSMMMSSGFSGPATAYAGTVDGEGGMARLKLILGKLRDSMESMKDFDELEKAGMAKKDVDRKRRAMRIKIEQMTEDAIASIRDL